MIAISGAMIQQEIGQSFLGPVYEEKFHVRCSSMTILPCLPLVPEALRDRLHPDVSPNQIQEGIKNGYFLTNLSMNQVFAVPEFRELEQEGEIYLLCNTMIIFINQISLMLIKMSKKMITCQRMVIMSCTLTEMK